MIEAHGTPWVLVLVFQNKINELLVMFLLTSLLLLFFVRKRAEIYCIYLHSIICVKILFSHSCIFLQCRRLLVYITPFCYKVLKSVAEIVSKYIHVYFFVCFAFLLDVSVYMQL